MTFFEQQARARRSTRWLVLMYLLAVLGIVLAVNCTVAVTYLFTFHEISGPPQGATREAQRLLDQHAPGRALLALSWAYLYHVVPQKLYWASSLATLLVVFGASLAKVSQLGGGGEAVAKLLGARRVAPGSEDPLERRLLNVVEEMAIASGVSVPPVYVMDEERAINAFAAGYEPNHAVVSVTRGALESLNRDELQGVIGHEFSHILNGDMRLNVRLIGVLFGIVFIGQIGQFLLRLSAGRSEGSASRKSDIRILLLGAMLAVIGYIGLFFARLIKAAISRQREYLADASSVQFTRNPEGLASALERIAGAGSGTYLHNLHAEETSHMFFVQSIAMSFDALFATHPPLEERIGRIRPGFGLASYRRRRREQQAAAPEVESPVAAAFAGAQQPAPAAGGGGRGAAQALVAAVGQPEPRHMDFAARLLDSLPQGLRARLADHTGAQQAILALVLDREEHWREHQLERVASARGAEFARAVAQAGSGEHRVARALHLTLVSLALPTLRSMLQAERDGFLALLRELIEADQRITLSEFVLLTILAQSLRADAGRAIPVKYRSIAEVGGDAQLVISLLAHASRTDNALAFTKGIAALGGTAALGLKLGEPPAREELTYPRVTAALERLRMLAPLAKPALIKACAETATADGELNTVEMELLRAVSATLDCPLPPVIEARDPQSLAA